MQKKEKYVILGVMAAFSINGLQYTRYKSDTARALK